MGVVRTIREMLKPQTEIFVCEMGAKNIGDIKEICDIVEPDLGMITSVGPQHLETFKSVDNVFNTKFELAEAVKAKGGKAFVNGDSNEIAKRISYGDFSVYGTDDKCNYKAKNITYGKFGSLFEVTLGGEKLKLTSRLLGLHSIINITGAAAIAHSLGVSNEEIKFAVASLKPYEHRLEMKPSLNGSVMIDDAYNANPEGSIEAVRVLGSFDGMKKVIITPGLIELGEKEYECNRTLGLEAAGICDIIILVGKNRSKPLADGVNSTEFNKDNLFIASSFMEAMEIYSRFADNNTVLLIENDLPDNYLN
jgi:UDP-N-acetylmuramoyl-tripeptide--D-alanyl-D-alanine ligase